MSRYRTRSGRPRPPAGAPGVPPHQIPWLLEKAREKLRDAETWGDPEMAREAREAIAALERAQAGGPAR